MRVGVCTRMLVVTAVVLAASATVTAGRPLAKHYRIGDKVADFRLPTDTGGKVQLSQFRGRPVVIVFYASWCSPCNAEAPQVEKRIWRAYRKRGVEVLGLAINENVKDPRVLMRKFRRKHHITYPLLSDETAAVMARWGFEGIPSIVVIDREGRYAANPEDIEATITALGSVLAAKKT